MVDDVNTEHTAWIDVNTETECMVDDVNTEHTAWLMWTQKQNAWLMM